MTGVSFVVPVHNGEKWLNDVVRSILDQDDGRAMEIILIDDGSTDASPDMIRAWTKDPRVRVIKGEGRGAAAAVNLGFMAAAHPLIAQIDQDVILQPGWLSSLVAELDDEAVAAVQGLYVTDKGAPLMGRLAGYELEMRYRNITGNTTDQVCTGNSLYRRAAVAAVGGLDESLGYGYDNDLSYRLIKDGHNLVICRQAHSYHRWKQRPLEYLRQQFGLGYGRLDIIAKHRDRMFGDRVSGPGMILHVPAMLLVLVAALGAVFMAGIGAAWRLPALAAALIVLVLAVERLTAAVAAARHFGDPAALFLVLLHLGRDLAWVWALMVWSTRRMLRRPSSPWHSMKRQ